MRTILDARKRAPFRSESSPEKVPGTSFYSPLRCSLALLFIPRSSSATASLPLSACLQTRVNSAEYMTSPRKLAQHGGRKKSVDDDDDDNNNDGRTALAAAIDLRESDRGSLYFRFLTSRTLVHRQWIHGREMLKTQRQKYPILLAQKHPVRSSRFRII